MLNQDLGNAGTVTNLQCPSSEDENDFLAADDLNVEEDFEFNKKQGIFTQQHHSFMEREN